MTDEANKKGPESTRRKFLTATTALAGAALAGLPGVAGAERKRNPKRGGTVRFGTDPAASALDTFCRAHDHPNLYVVDASFLPTSAAVNPALTIAAQALRVADHLAAAQAPANLEAAHA